MHIDSVKHHIPPPSNPPPRPPPPPTMNDTELDYLWKRHHDLRVRVLSNLLYQQKRQTVMQWRDQASKLGTLFGATAIFAQWSSASHHVQMLGAAIGVLSLVSLTFAFSAKAQDAARRAAHWGDLNREIEKVGERAFDEAMLNQWFARAGEIEHGEPAQNGGLFQKCYERACLLLGGEPRHKEGSLIVPPVFRPIS